jgi:predicted  nucleic acid-binding Zn-ribbon protein
MLDPNIDATLAPLLRRIDVLENVVNAHHSMNFSMQIDSLYDTINEKTDEIVQLLNELHGTVELTESQLDDIAKRVSNLNPTQEVLAIRDELNRLTELEKNHPLVNLSTEITSLNQRVSAFETMLPPETLEAILEDIALLKEKIQCNPFCPSEGEILIIQDQIKDLMDSAVNHSDAIEGLETLAELLENSASDRDTKLAEIEIELDTLEHAIQTVINNGNILNLGIPTVVSELEEDNRETRALVDELAAKVDELKARLRYYSTCLHSRDCRPGQRCDKHSECQWSPGSIVCAWEKLHCADKCHASGDCHMMKHVWKKEFTTECRSGLTCDNFVLDNDDLNITLIGEPLVELVLGQNVSTYKDAGALCSDARWKYDIKTSVVPPFNPKSVGDYNWKYDCHGITTSRIVRVRYPICDPNYYITCPDGSRAFQRKEFLCTVACPSSGYDCHKDRYAGPGCKCSPITGACLSFYGDIEATWDGTNCGCRCRTGLKLINNNCV